MFDQVMEAQFQQVFSPQNEMPCSNTDAEIARDFGVSECAEVSEDAREQSAIKTTLSCANKQRNSLILEAIGEASLLQDPVFDVAKDDSIGLMLIAEAAIAADTKLAERLFNEYLRLAKTSIGEILVNSIRDAALGNAKANGNY